MDKVIEPHRATKRLDCLVTPSQFEKFKLLKQEYNISAGRILRTVIDMMPVDGYDDSDAPIVIKKKS